MVKAAVFIASLSLVTSLVTCTFAIYLFTNDLLKEKPTSVRGREGGMGLPGDNGTCDETKAINLLNLYVSLNETTSAFDFCPTITCDELSYLTNDIETTIDESNLRGVNLIPLASDISLVKNITTNGTFCLQTTCTTHQSVIDAILLNFGTSNQTGLLAQIAALLIDLEGLISNDTFVRYPVTDASIVNGSISAYKINGLVANSVVITNPSGVLTTTLLLDTTRGGTNKNSTGWTGIPFINNGDWNVNATINYNTITLSNSIVNADIATSANISRTKIQTGTPDYVVITDSNGKLTSEQYLSPIRGGHGISMANATGYTLWQSGVVTQVDLLARSHISAGNVNEVVINSASGLFTSEPRLATTRGGTGQNSASWSGYVVVRSGVWNVTSGNLTYSDLNLTNAIVNADVATAAAIARSKLASGTINHVLINDGSGVMSSEATLATTRGGTNIDSSGSTGYCYVTSGTWSFQSNLYYNNITFSGLIVDADVSTSAAIQRSKIATGTANHVLINNGTGHITSEAQLAASRGGTGIDTSGSTGFPKLTTGVWSIVSVLSYANLQLSLSIVNNDVSTTAAIARSKIQVGTANHVVINDGSGVLSSEARLANTRGGIGQDSSAWSAVPLVTTGTWSAGVPYVEGTWTPTLTFGGASTGITQTVSLGKYTRFGGLIFVEISVVLSSKGSATGQARISLPIAAASPSTGSSGPVLIENIDLAANYYTAFFTTESGSATAYLVFSGDNNGAVIATDASFSSTSAFRCQFYYSP